MEEGWGGAGLGSWRGVAGVWLATDGENLESPTRSLRLGSHYATSTTRRSRLAGTEHGFELTVSREPHFFDPTRLTTGLSPARTLVLMSSSSSDEPNEIGKQLAEQSFTVFTDAVRAEDAEKLPPLSMNMFTRLVRNPFPASRRPRETACSQMLCVLLEHSAAFRNSWLGKRLKLPLDDQLEFDVQTEAITGGQKRIDLVFRAVERVEDSLRCRIVVAIEVKVDAPDTLTLDRESEADGGLRMVSQLVPYDRWLSGETAEHKAGVLISSRPRKFPPDVGGRWVNVLWSELGKVARACLPDLKPSTDEWFLLTHFLGFVSAHFTRGEKLPVEKISFNDLSLLHALGRSGEQLEKKIKHLTQVLPAILTCSDIGSGEPKVAINLWTNWPYGGLASRPLFTAQSKSNKSAIEVAVTAGPDYNYPVIVAQLFVVPLKGKSKQFNSIGDALLLKLNDIVPGWEFGGMESDDDEPERCYFLLETPFAAILNAKDQVDEVSRILIGALEAIKEVGVLTELAGLIEDK